MRPSSPYIHLVHSAATFSLPSSDDHYRGKDIAFVGDPTDCCVPTLANWPRFNRGHGLQRRLFWTVRLLRNSTPTLTTKINCSIRPIVWVKRMSHYHKCWLFPQILFTSALTRQKLLSSYTTASGRMQRPTIHPSQSLTVNPSLTGVSWHHIMTQCLPQASLPSLLKWPFWVMSLSIGGCSDASSAH